MKRWRGRLLCYPIYGAAQGPYRVQHTCGPEGVHGDQEWTIDHYPHLIGPIKESYVVDEPCDEGANDDDSNRTGPSPVVERNVLLHGPYGEENPFSHSVSMRSRMC